MMTNARIIEFCQDAIAWAEQWRHLEAKGSWPRDLDVASEATLEQVQAAMPGWTVRPAPMRTDYERKYYRKHGREYWPGVFLIWPPWAPPTARELSQHEARRLRVGG